MEKEIREEIMRGRGRVSQKKINESNQEKIRDKAFQYIEKKKQLRNRDRNKRKMR